GDVQKLTFDSLRDSKWRVQMIGSFEESKTLSPGDALFSYKSELKASPADLFFLYQYNFAGRTGEKTFDLAQITREGSSPRTEKKISVYLDNESSLPLRIPLFSKDTGCASSDTPRLK